MPGTELPAAPAESGDELDKALDEANNIAAAPAPAAPPAPPPTAATRPPATTEEAPPPEEEELMAVEVTNDDVANLYDSVFGAVATRWGEEWKLQEFERDNLAKATKKVLDKYMIKLTPEKMLLGWGLFILGPRIMLTMGKAKEEKKPAPAPAAPPASPKKESAPAPEPSPVSEPEKPQPKEHDGWSGNKAEAEKNG